MKWRYQPEHKHQGNVGDGFADTGTGESTGGGVGGTDFGKEDAVTDSGTKELPDTVTDSHNHTENTVVKNQRAAMLSGMKYSMHQTKISGELKQ